MNGLLSPAVIVQYLLRAVVVLITIPFHESAHALASHQSAAGVGVDDPVQAVLVQRAGGCRARADDVPILYGSHESEPGGFQSAAGAAV